MMTKQVLDSDPDFEGSNVGYLMPNTNKHTIMAYVSSVFSCFLLNYKRNFF